jgi:glycosyltransferase involved in cell wall biosynthesis
MRIVQIITRADALGGASVHVRDLCCALAKNGDDVTVLIGGDGPVTEDLRSHGVACRTIRHLQRRPDPVRDLLAVAEIVVALRTLRPDLVATHTAKAGALGRLAAALLNTPCVYTAHGWSITDRSSSRWGAIFRYIERLAGLFSPYIINVCNSEQTLALAYKIAKPSKLVVVHNGVHDVPSELRADPLVQPPRIVMVARMDQQKDHPTLIHALAALKHKAWQLELIGDGPRRPDLVSLVRRCGLENRVSFLGESSRVAQRIAKYQIFVLTTNFEGFPLSILEAMRSGLPVIATDVNGVSEQVVNGDTGLLVGKRNIASVQNALATLIDGPRLRKQMGDSGRHLYESRFTFDLMFKRTRAVYVQARHSTPLDRTELALTSRASSRKGTHTL